MSPRTSERQGQTWRTTSSWKSTKPKSHRPPALTLTAEDTANAKKKQQEKGGQDAFPLLPRHLLSAAEVQGAPQRRTGPPPRAQPVLKSLQNGRIRIPSRRMQCRQRQTPPPHPSLPDQRRKKGPIRGLRPQLPRRGGWPASPWRSSTPTLWLAPPPSCARTKKPRV